MSLPPYLLHIFTHTLEGEPMTNPTWGLLGDADVEFLACASQDGIIILGELSIGEYLVDPADIGLDYKTCKAYWTARDQYAALASETDLYSLTAEPGVRQLACAILERNATIRDNAFTIINAMAFNITERHRAERHVTLFGTTA
jgi:hypothetical protein